MKPCLGHLSALALLVVLPAFGQVGSYAVIKNFSNSGASAQPQAVIEGSNGLLYGTTSLGGSANQGALYSINKNGGSFSILKNFKTTDGTLPQAAVLVGSDGVLYGTTAAGGAKGNGTVFKINKNGSGYKVLHSFAGGHGDGAAPAAPLIEASNGVLYGTTVSGGLQSDYVNGLGTVFKINKDGSGYAVLKFFSGIGDGEAPRGALIEGKTGLLYGTVYYGGANDQGAVFALNKAGTSYAVLKSFGGADGIGPYGLCQGTDGVLYGTTVSGGQFGDGGTLFALDEDGSAFTVLRSFQPMSATGAYPYAPVIEGSDGMLYGTASSGGTGSDGTVFRVNRDGSNYTVLKAFSANGSDGASPRTPVIIASDAAIYGTTFSGGASSGGVLFKLSLTPPPSSHP
jgi:uncharacterized repeat protein (TIGR03803 family)